MPQTPDPSWRDGIRSLHLDEFADLDTLLSTVFRFGTLDHSENTLLASGGQAAEALRQIFPIPALWYGINYV